MKSAISHSLDSWKSPIHHPIHDWFSTISVKLSNLVHHAADTLLRAPELRVWTGKTCSGEPCWNLYDPVTGNHARLYSQEEVRIWIEERYSH